MSHKKEDTNIMAVISSNLTISKFFNVRFSRKFTIKLF